MEGVGSSISCQMVPSIHWHEINDDDDDDDDDEDESQLDHSDFLPLVSVTCICVKLSLV